MAKIKRVFVVEGIDDGKFVGNELIKAMNRLVEEAGLDVSSTAREKILTDLLSPGKFGRVLAYMNHSDIAGVYSQPGGVKKFVDAALSTQADVTEALKMINGGLKDAAGWLQVPALKSNRMPLSTLNGPEDSVVVLNVPKTLLNFTKPASGKEGAQEFLEKLLSHNYFIAHLNTRQAKQGGVDVGATTVDELLNHFNFEAITGYKSKETRADAHAEWKKVKERQTTDGEERKSASDAVESPAHQFADWIEEYRLEHRMPKTESAAYEFYFKAKTKLDELSNGSAKLRRAAREAGVKMVKPDSGLWEKLATGDIDGYMKIIKARADAAGETLPKDDKPKVKPEEEKKEEPKADEKPAEKPAVPAPTEPEVKGEGDLPAPLERLAGQLASGIKDNRAWDPKHRGSLVAAIQKALAGD